MRIVIVFNHPYENSYCSAILQAVTKGALKGNHTVDLIHLDQDEFNPVLNKADLKAFIDRNPTDQRVIDYSQRLAQADHWVFIFPIWWELMPALTKGFIDRVFFPGVAYEHKEKGFGMIPLFKKLKGITVITTMNQPRFIYWLLFSDPVKKSLINGTFLKTGYKQVKWICLGGVKTASDQKRKKWLSKFEQKFAQLQ